VIPASVDAMSEFTHVVEVDLPERRVKVWRLFDDGRRQFFTEVHFVDGMPSDAEKILLQQIGEDILLDSPSGRSLLNV
jgi:hypothetical protein